MIIGHYDLTPTTSDVYKKGWLSFAGITHTHSWKLPSTATAVWVKSLVSGQLSGGNEGGALSWWPED